MKAGTRVGKRGPLGTPSQYTLTPVSPSRFRYPTLACRCYPTPAHPQQLLCAAPCRPMPAHTTAHQGSHGQSSPQHWSPLSQHPNLLHLRFPRPARSHRPGSTGRQAFAGPYCGSDGHTQVCYQALVHGGYHSMQGLQQPLKRACLLWIAAHSHHSPKWIPIYTYATLI